MHILVISDFFPNKTMPHEGIFVYNQLTELKKYARFTVLVPRIIYPPLKRYRKLKREFDLFCDEERLKFVSIKYWHIPVIGELIMPLITPIMMFYSIKKKKINFDFIHAFWAYRSGYWAYLLSKIFKKKYIVTLLGSDINYWLHERWKRKRIITALRNASGIIGLSEDLLKKIQNLNVTAKQKCIPNGIDINLFNSRIKNISKNRKEVKIICIANHYYVKGVDLLLQALAELKLKSFSFSVTLIGDGPEKLKLRQLTSTLSLQNSVHFKGIVPHDQIPSYLHESDLLVIPSRNEGLGTVIFEALSCGVPVVGFKVGGIPEALKYGKYGILVEQESPCKLADAINFAFTKKWDKKELRKYALQFSWSKIADQIFSVYQNVQEL